MTHAAACTTLRQPVVAGLDAPQRLHLARTTRAGSTKTDRLLHVECPLTRPWRGIYRHSVDSTTNHCSNPVPGTSPGRRLVEALLDPASSRAIAATCRSGHGPRCLQKWNSAEVHCALWPKHLASAGAIPASAFILLDECSVICHAAHSTMHNSVALRVIDP